MCFIDIACNYAEDDNIKTHLLQIDCVREINRIGQINATNTTSVLLFIIKPPFWISCKITIFELNTKEILLKLLFS